MKTNGMIKPLLSSFFTSAILASVTTIAIKYYIPFIQQTAGSYSITMLFGETLRDFLIKVLLLVSGLLAFAFFLIKGIKYKKQKRFSPGFMIALGIVWLILPLLSAYSISRFTGTLIPQTITGIAIIANVVFMMASVCFGIFAVIDIVHNLLLFSEKGNQANCAAMLLSGVPAGCAAALLLSSALQPAIGLSGIFILFASITIVIGLIDMLFDKIA